jgi:hypothetical protein
MMPARACRRPPIVRINATGEPTRGFRNFEQSPVGVYINNSPVEGYIQLDDIKQVEVRGPQEHALWRRFAGWRAAPAAQCARIRQARRQCDRQHRHGRHASQPSIPWAALNICRCGAGLPWQRQVRPDPVSSMPMA